LNPEKVIIERKVCSLLDALVAVGGIFTTLSALCAIMSQALAYPRFFLEVISDTFLKQKKM
jgi:hypothetical protein